MPPSPDLASRQRSWDDKVIQRTKCMLMDRVSDPISRARLLAASSPHSGDWLNALPIASVGLRLSDEEIRIATGFRLGINLGAPHQCICGTSVDALGLHALSCGKVTGRHQRHNQINDIICRSLQTAHMHAVKEPAGLLREDGKRPDGMSSIPWTRGRCLVWDVTVADTFAASYLRLTASTADAAAEKAAQRKVSKYTALIQSYYFVSVAIETSGAWSRSGSKLIQEIGKRLSELSGDTRETGFLFQRISVAIQC